MKQKFKVLAIILTFMAVIFYGFKHIANKMIEDIRGDFEPFTAEVIRCNNLTTRRVQVDYLGFDTKGSYEIGLRLVNEEFPPNVLEARQDKMGTIGREGIDGHQVYYAIPIDENKNPLILPPPSFDESGSDEQKSLYNPEIYPNYDRNPEDYEKYFSNMFDDTYVIQGYEYQFVDENGVYYRSPYFDIVAWNEGEELITNDKISSTYEYVPNFSELKNLTVRNDVWEVPENEKC